MIKPDYRIGSKWSLHGSIDSDRVYTVVKVADWDLICSYKERWQGREVVRHTVFQLIDGIANCGTPRLVIPRS